MQCGYFDSKILKLWPIQMKATEQNYINITVVLFLTLYKVVVTLDSENDFLKCDHSNESFMFREEL